MNIKENFVVIGGGTGTYSVLSGLKKYTNNITAIVTMADSGGSAKKERDEWGLLPSSDIRKSLLALADVSTRDNLLLRKLLQYRYDRGVGVSGMTFGNLFLIALTNLLGSQTKAIKKASEFLRIKGKVLPVTMDKIDLVATYADGTQVVGEHSIDEPRHDGKVAITNLTTKPIAHITPDVNAAIRESDILIIGPGGFYTTVIANLVIEGMKEAILASRAKKIFIMNLMTEYGQTYGYTSRKFIEELDKYFPINVLDLVFINNCPIPKNVLKKYQRFHAEPIVNDLNRSYPFQLVEADLLSPRRIHPVKGDTLNRSLIRHDGDKIAQICMGILGLL